VALAENTMQATNARFANAGGEVVDERTILDAMPQISFVATGVVAFEPPAPSEPWAKVFLMYIYIYACMCIYV